MERNEKNFSASDEEILENTDTSSLDAWIEPEMLRRRSKKNLTMQGEIAEEN